jgi:hypothetical protein
LIWLVAMLILLVNFGQSFIARGGKMKRIVSCLWGGFFICVLMSVVVWAQATAQINGTVKDATGAVLPGVEIMATQTETGIIRSTVTNETGSYVLPNLAVGPYRFEAALPGFRTYIQTGIVLQVNSNPLINAVLEVGQVTEQVEVQANATLVETRSVGVGQVIENERILELPLNGRQATDLIVLAGAAVQTVPNNADRAMVGSVAMSVAGGLSTGTVYLLDGAMHNDPYGNANLPLPFPDALQEFKVETSALSAQNGMYSGAAVTSVTKSGTNNFHGDLFEFVRNDLFNARNYFATKNSTLKRNQFGGTFGGPIKQNRIFFFGGYQGTTVRADPGDNKQYVPTTAMMAGDFTAIASPACNSGRQIALRAPFVNNRINPATFSKPAVLITNKLPKTSDPCGLVTFGARRVTDENQLVGKIDYQRNDKDSLFGRFIVTKYKKPNAYALEPNLLLSSQSTENLGFDNMAQSYTLGDTYLLSPNTINSFRLAVNQTEINRVPAQFFQGSDIGVNIYSYDPKQIKVDVTGGFSIGGGYGPGRNTAYQASDDLSLVRGTHQMAFGTNLAYWRNHLNAVTNSSIGSFTFNGQTTGLGLADFLTGTVSAFTEKSAHETYMSQWYLGAYWADTWRATPRLTLNYGVRWEPFIPPVTRNGIIANFSDERFKAGTKSTVFKNAPAGFYYPGDPGFPGTKCRPSGVCNATGMYSQWGNFTPRLGFAWDVRGDGRMSLRASYGMAHDMLTGGFFNNLITAPWDASIALGSTPGGFENPWLGYPGGNPFPTKTIDPNADFPAYGSYLVVPYDAPAMTRHSWNLSLQRQIAADWLLSASYMGSQAVHLWGNQELNPAVYFPGGPCTINGVTYSTCSTTANIAQRRRLSLQGTPVGFLDQYQPGGTQSYHGLLASVQRRAARGVTVGANYTWSHCYGDISRASAAGTPGSTYLDPYNRDFDRGNCEGDRRHIFNLTAVAETPQFANATLRAVATGWRLSGIYRKSSGSWLSVTSGVDRALTGVSSQRAQQVLGDPYGDKSLTKYLNPASFALPALGTLGNMSPNNIQGPGTWQFDVALSRVFRIRETHKVETRAEVYNLTNSLRPGNPTTTFNSNIFGQINSSGDPRIMQFALKYVF